MSIPSQFRTGGWRQWSRPIRTADAKPFWVVVTSRGRKEQAILRSIRGIFNNNPNIVFTPHFRYPFSYRRHVAFVFDGPMASVMQAVVASGTYTVSPPGTPTGRGGRRLSDLRRPWLLSPGRYSLRRVGSAP